MDPKNRIMKRLPIFLSFAFCGFGLMRMSAQAFPASFFPTILDGDNGFVIRGGDTSGLAGVALSGVGDVNGDGIDDMVLGAPQAEANGVLEAGEAYVVFGRRSGFEPVLDVGDLNGENGFALQGFDERHLVGARVSGAGDVNGDGVEDLVIGAESRNPGESGVIGESFVVFGQRTGFPPRLVLSALDGENGFVVQAEEEESGVTTWAVSGIGDVNGDGVDDLLLGHALAGPVEDMNRGEAYVVFGTTEGFEAFLNVRDLNGFNGFVIRGVQLQDFLGRAVSGVGDVNGDGISDLIVGAPGRNTDDLSNVGLCVVVFGRVTGFGALLDIEELNGRNGFAISGFDRFAEAGTLVRGAGDVNGDGLMDLLLGTANSSLGGTPTAAESYVIFGQSGDFPAEVPLETLDGFNGFVVEGLATGEIFLGKSVAGVGDVNGDGIDDILVGSASADAEGIRNSGEAYVIYGRRWGGPARFDVQMLDGEEGFVVQGIQQSDGLGAAASGVGDLNGDGLADFAVAAPGANPNGVANAGEVYVVFGQGISTGLPAEIGEGALEAFPNPTTGQVTLVSELLLEPGEVEVVVHDPLGRVVRRESVAGGKEWLQLDLGGLVSGGYLVRLLGEGWIAVGFVMRY